MPHRIYFWRVQDRNGRWYKTRFRTTEEHIRKEHPEPSASTLTQSLKHRFFFGSVVGLFSEALVG